MNKRSKVTTYIFIEKQIIINCSTRNMGQPAEERYDTRKRTGDNKSR
jgi:hypothetical protein